MFNIIETLRNYFTRELLPDNLSNEMAPLQHIKLVAAIFGGKLFGGSVLPASAAPVPEARCPHFCLQMPF